ncbi:ent-kaur-16-ene synthase, chloroplastic-like isoform X2 [Mercurialis annua]|uniref:ent-kaur-16-ene synthase, chloroplastic-like isoform X2 n=1 Tax=Mercurialis annua TaxID=3986 RepID=UPI0021604698|nr:ent-kaur-16-ene synthase, chloroplastic-like isoform X2 [Mercurialis annua]
MSVLTSNVLTLACERKIFPSLQISNKLTRFRIAHTKNCMDEVEKTIKRKKVVEKAKLSVSSYDTAWVAMVPSKESKEKPSFPECLDWIMKNQHCDGSWCHNPYHPLLVKDYISCTLACVLALQKWKVGQSLIKRGLEFIEANYWAATDERQLTPIGFNIIFPAMIELAMEYGLEVPFHLELLDLLLQNRENEIARYELEGTKVHLAYLIEGLGKKCKWEEMNKYQNSNGSFFNSPSATAAALFYNHNQQCYDYLTILLKNDDNAVPTTYPSQIYSQLCAIDNIQKLGIDDIYFRIEIDNTLDDIYRLWMQSDEEIYLDVNCCALGFRLLRLKGYNVSSDALAHVSEEEYFFNSVSPQFKSTKTIMELYKASKLSIYENEFVLEKLEVWTYSFLKQQLLTDVIKDSKLREEVGHVLKYRYDSLNFLEIRWGIEQQKADNVALLKTSYRWVKVCRFEELNFARLLLLNCYYTNSAVLVAPELADARIAITKNCILATVVDDFFDIAGSKEELENLVQLVQRWGETSTIGYRSEQVKIIFSALEDMIKELDSIAFKHHGRSVEHHLVKIWHELLKSMMQEAAWAREDVIPSLDEYMENAYISFALGPICHITTYFLGITLPEEVMIGPQLYNLFKHVSLVGRLFNDLQSFKREREQGKYNSISLRVFHSQGSITEKEAIEDAKKDIEMYRKELLRLSVQKEENSLPKPFRELFWNFSNVLHYFYIDNDGYSNPKIKMANDAKIVLWEPASLL